MSVSSGLKKLSWIEWFCGLRGNEFFCEVDEGFIKDKFNLTGLNELVPCFKQALDAITNPILQNGDVGDPNLPDQLVTSSAEVLYGYIHARYILTDRGIALMVVKSEKRVFGVCPRVYCEAQTMLPVGLSDVRGEATVKVYCPRCQEVYVPKSPCHQNTDGAYFGTGFPHMLFMVHPGLRPEPASAQYEPRLYGFKIHPNAYSIQRQAEFKMPVRAGLLLNVKREDRKKNVPYRLTKPKVENGTSGGGYQSEMKR